MFCTKSKLLTRKTVLKVSLFQTFYLCRLLWSLKIYRFTKIVNFDTFWIYPISFKYFFQYFWETGETHNLKNISKVHGPTYFYGVGKECLCQMLLSFSKIEVLLWHEYREIYHYENLRSSTYSIYVYFYYIIVCIFMFIELWCIIAAFQLFCKL